MRGHKVPVVVVALVLAASCGGDGGSSSPVADRTTPASTPSTSEVEPVPPTADAPPTAPASTPSTSEVEPETKTPSSEPASPATPPRDLLDPWPATAIDWATVGTGWVVFKYVVPDVLDDPDADHDVTLMLLSPSDDVYEVGALPGPYPVAFSIQDISADGRSALLSSWEDDRESFWLLDLPTMTLVTFPAPTGAWAARLGRDGSSVLVKRLFTTQQSTGAWLTDRIVLLRVALDGSDPQQLVDLPISPEQQHVVSYFSWIELDSGEVATTEDGTVNLRAADGRLLRQLHAPSPECTLAKQWSDNEVLACCLDPERDSGCWTNGLFLIPTTGDESVEVAMPSSAGACVAGYSKAVPLVAHVALERSQGEGECTQLIEITDGTSTSTWQPGHEPLCNATLIGVRNTAWLALARPSHGTFGSQHEGPGILFEIRADGSSRPITPTDLPSSWNAPGVTDVHVIGAT